MSSRPLIVVVLGALGALGLAAVACVSSSSNPSGGSSSGGSTEDGGGSSSGTGSSSSGTGSSGSSSGGTCTYQISGGTTASGSCTAVGAYAANNTITAFGITPGTTTPIFGVSVELGDTPAAWQAGTYTTANVRNASGDYEISAPDGGLIPETWIYLDKDGGTDGGFTLTLTSTGTEFSYDAGDSWVYPHGTLTMTLNPGSGTTQPVTATATF